MLYLFLVFVVGTINIYNLLSLLLSPWNQDHTRKYGGQKSHDTVPLRGEQYWHSVYYIWAGNRCWLSKAENILKCFYKSLLAFFDHQVLNEHSYKFIFSLSLNQYATFTPRAGDDRIRTGSATLINSTVHQLYIRHFILLMLPKREKKRKKCFLWQYWIKYTLQYNTNSAQLIRSIAKFGFFLRFAFIKKEGNSMAKLRSSYFSE